MPSGANPTPDETAQAPLPARVEQPGSLDMPTALADKIRIVEHHLEDGRTVRSLQIDRDLRDRAIVLTPVQEVMQADPNYTPSVRLMWVDVDGQTYKMPDRPPAQQGGEWVKMRGLSKQTIEDAGKLAGIDVVESDTVASGDPNIIKANARIRYRRSDGTWQYRSDGGEILVDVEAEEIADRLRDRNEAHRAAGRTQKVLDEAALGARIRQEQREQKRHYPAKARTKAILRAMRGLLSLQHAYPEADLRQKPIIVVGYNFTPDRSDPAVQRAMLESEFAVFGRPGVEPASESPALPPGASGDDSGEEAPAASPTAAPPAGYQPVEGEVTDEDDDGFSYTEPAGDEPIDASAFVVSFGRAFPGRTIAAIHADGGAKGLSYLRYLAGLDAPDGRSFKADTPQKRAAREAAQAFLHALGQAAA